MKLTKSQLRKIIKEEIKRVLTEQLSPEQYLERAKRQPSIMADLYQVALGDPDTLQYMPDFMTAKFARKTLLGMASSLRLSVDAPRDQEGWLQLTNAIEDAL